MKHIEWLTKKPEPQKGHYLIECDNGRSDHFSVMLPRGAISSGVNYVWWIGKDPREALIVCQAAFWDGYDVIVYQEANGKWAGVGTKNLRAPDDKCEAYEGGTPAGPEGCNGDGHYLCDHCIHKRVSISTVIGPEEKNSKSKGENT
jgi:hypothetical protein